jgi:hypothetical protein
MLKFDLLVYSVVIVNAKIFPPFGWKCIFVWTAVNPRKVSKQNDGLLSSYTKVLHWIYEIHYAKGLSEMGIFDLLSWAVHWRVLLGIAVVVLFCFIKCADHTILDKSMNHVWLNCWKAKRDDNKYMNILWTRCSLC